jgi:hypothetical protein
VRKLTAIVTLLLLSIVLVSCGTGGDEEAEPTDEPTTVVQTEPTEPADVAIPGTPSLVTEENEATPVEVAATPAMGIATPATSDVASPAASPVMHTGPEGSPVATPVGVASLEASPVASPVASVPLAVPPISAPTEAPAAMIEMSGMVTLDGVENTAFIMTDKGCIGLGQYSGLHQGRQVVVRNEAGTIVSVTTLDASAAEGCAWDFVVQVPESDFYSVSIPMEFEQVFPKAQVNEDNGEVVIALP